MLKLTVNSVTHRCTVIGVGVRECMHAAANHELCHTPMIGLQGPGQMELSVAKYMVQIDPAPAAFVIDCLPDMDAAAVSEKTGPLVRSVATAAHGGAVTCWMDMKPKPNPTPNLNTNSSPNMNP
jgi:hypothetical protein